MTKKKIVITAVSIVAVCAIGIGGILMYRSRTAKPVKVYGVESLNSASWYGDDSQLTGNITSEFVQEVYQDTSQEIKKIYVKEGDKVKIGDKLLKYNIEEKELELKLKQLQIKGAQYEIQRMEKELETLKKNGSVATKRNDGTSLAAANDLLGKTMVVAEGEAGTTTQVSPTDAPTTEEKPVTDAPTTEEPSTDAPTTEDKPTTETPSTDEPSTDPSTEKPNDPTPGNPTPEKPGKLDVSIRFTSGRTDRSVNKGESYQLTYKVNSGKKPSSVEWWVFNQNSEATTINNRGLLTVAKDETSTVLSVYVIVRDDVVGMLDLTVNGNETPPATNDYNSGGNYGGGYYYGGGYDSGGDTDGGTTYTYSELREAISEKESDIAKKKQELNESKISYKEAKREVSDATVKATIAGTVTTAYTKKSAPSDGSPLIVIKAEDGIYVETAISEMALSTVKVGGTLTCTAWDTNETYEASVVSIADYPTDSNSENGIFNPNSSYYKVIGFIADAGTLNTNQQVTIAYNSQSMGTVGDETIYLHKAYIRTDGAQSYVYKKGAHNRLEKQYIKTGTTVNGNYIEVKSGITTQDQIAFPYGKNVKDGAKTKLSEDLDDVIY